MDIIRIAAFGLTELEITALSEILDDCTNIDNPGDSVSPDSLSDMYDCFLTETTFLISHLDFFLRHRQQTVVWVSHKSSETIKEPIFKVLSAFDSGDKIRSVILSLKPKNEENTTKEKLSQREVQVLCEIASGKTNKEIADSLFISVNTVITHRKNISSKLGIRSASGMALYAMMNGLI